MDKISISDGNNTNTVNPRHYNKTALNLIYIVAMTIFFAMVFLMWYQFKTLLNDNALITHTHHVIQTTNNIVYKMTDIELDVRSYLLTNDENYISDLNLKSNNLKSSLQQFISLTKNNSSPMSNLVSNRLMTLDKLVQLKMNGTLLSSDIATLTSSNQIILDKLNASAAEVITSEQRFLHELNDRVISNIDTSKITIILGSSISAFLFLLIYLLYYLKFLKQDKLEIKLKDYDEINKNMQDVKDKNEKISLLLEMSDVMLASENIQELSNIIAKYCGRILNFSSGLFYIMHSSKNHLEATACWGTPSSNEGYFSVECCWSIRLGHIYDANTADKELLCEHVKKPGEVNGGNFSYLCIPLRARNDIYGLLYVEIGNPHNSSEDILSKNERLLVNSFTELATLALANIRLRDSLQYQSIRDSLTSLYNRRYLEEFLSKQLLQAERIKTPIALLMIDIDNFKKINDMFGHHAGDMALKELALLFLNDVRPGDLASRYGGEEFILVLHNVDRQVAKERAEKLRQDALLIQIKYGAQDIVNYTISIGISIYPQDGSTGPDLIKAADRALYFAKNSGKNKTVLLSDMMGTTKSTESF